MVTGLQATKAEITTTLKNKKARVSGLFLFPKIPKTYLLFGAFKLKTIATS
ncbi:hypothetical protein M899_1372 [Bacteriovorax sp. BSW11_IV]|nr:hypothetical protein M899_1372 [Bacteriovorax sp. BSW11_IV]